MITLLYQLQNTPALSPGADLAGFTFYSTDGNGHQLGNACTIDATDLTSYTHPEANAWFNSQHVQPLDVVAVVGHSYGGDRARRFVDELKAAGTTVDLLATVDPINWDYCAVDLALLGGAWALCDQSQSLSLHHAANAQSFHQILGLQVGPLVFPLKGYTLYPATVIQRPDYHSEIDKDATVQTTITSGLLSLIRGPQVAVVPGVATRSTGNIAVPFTISVTGKGTATGATVTTASLNGVPGGNTPIALGDIVAGTSSSSLQLSFPGTAANSGATVVLSVSEQFSYGQQFSGNVRVKVP
jgi:hypothetical protein